LPTWRMRPVRPDHSRTGPVDIGISSSAMKRRPRIPSCALASPGLPVAASQSIPRTGQPDVRARGARWRWRQAGAIMREHARLAHRNLERALPNQKILDLVPGSTLSRRRARAS
jgi:hypothetical protein